MWKHYDVVISFPWDVDSNNLPNEEKMIVNDFNNINLVCLLIEIEEKSTLGLQITAESNDQFSIESTLNFLIHGKKNKNYSDSVRLELDNKNNTKIICSNIPINDVKYYLAAKRDTFELKINFNISISMKKYTSKQPFTGKSMKSSKSKSQYTKNDESDRIRRAKPENNQQYDPPNQKAKSNQNQTSMKRSKLQSQAQLIRNKKSDYSDKTKNSEYDYDTEYDNELPKHERFKKKQTVNRSKDYIREESHDAKSRQKDRPIQKKQQKIHIKETKNDENIEDEGRQGQRNSSKNQQKKSRRNTQTPMKSKKEDDETNQKLERSIKMKTQSQAQILGEKDHNDSEYEYSGPREKAEKQIQIKKRNKNNDNYGRESIQKAHRYNYHNNDDYREYESDEEVEKTLKKQNINTKNVKKKSKNEEFEEEEDYEDQISYQKAPSKKVQKNSPAVKKRSQTVDENDENTKYKKKFKYEDDEQKNSRKPPKNKPRRQTQADKKRKLSDDDYSNEYSENESKNTKLKNTKNSHAKSQNQIVKCKSDSEEEEEIEKMSTKTGRKSRQPKGSPSSKKSSYDEERTSRESRGRKDSQKSSELRKKDKNESYEYDENSSSQEEFKKNKKIEKSSSKTQKQNRQKLKENEDESVKENKVMKNKKLEEQEDESSKESKSKKNKKLEEQEEESSKESKSKKNKKLEEQEDESVKEKKAKKNKKLEDESVKGNKEKKNKKLEEICPYIGLSNLGATCYMNSAIQVLFHTPLFRKKVLTFDTGITNVNDISAVKNVENKYKLILIHLQSLFYQMIHLMEDQKQSKFHKDYISTAQLTRSFGWTEQEISTQQDVHEFMINFFEVLDDCSRSKKDSITDIFKGQIITSISRKKDGKIVTHSFEDFYDFSLLVKGHNDIYQSLNLFTEKDILKKDSKTDSKQLIQVQFYSLPKVLHIHLRRFVYSQELCRTNKVNDYFSFPEKLDLSPYVFTKGKSDNSTDTASYKGECKYELYGVIVHQGKSSYIGHYYAYLNLQNNWYLFNDTRVKKVTKEEATKLNFGIKEGDETDEIDDVDSHCAYILVYVRKDAIDEVFKIPEIKIPKNILTCIDSLLNPGTNNNNNNSSNSSSFTNTFSNACTSSTIGFTLITEDCVRMNCKLGKAGIDNRSLCQRVNVPFDQFFTFSLRKNCKETFSIGGLYATVSVFLGVDLNQLNLWTVTSSYEIGEPLNKVDFEILKEMEIDQINKIKEKTNSQISPHVIFAEILPEPIQNEDEKSEETEETEESSSVTVKKPFSIMTKLYTYDLESPMLYTGILTNFHSRSSLNSIIKHHYKKRLIEMTREAIPNKEHEFISLIKNAKFNVYYEKKRSNIKSECDIYQLDLAKTLKSNHVPRGSFLIFSFKAADDEEREKLNELAAQLIKLHSIKKCVSNDAVVYRYCDLMLNECPDNPIDFCNLFTNTEKFDVYRYCDNHYFGKVELPCRISLTKLSEFIAFQFETHYNNEESKMLFFGDGPTLRPIEVTSKNDSSLFQITDTFRKSFFFSVVPKDFVFSDLCFTLAVTFSSDSVSQTNKFNFFVETQSEEDVEEQEAAELESKKENKKNFKKQLQLPINPYSKQTSVNPPKANIDVHPESFENVLIKVIDYLQQKKIGLSDLRCFWVSKETGQIVSDFIIFDQKKKKNNYREFIHEKDILVLNRELRVEIIPNDQKSTMKNISKMKLKSKENCYCGYRLEIYKSYVLEDFNDENDDGYDNSNNNSLPLLKVFDFPMVLTNIDNNMKVKKLKEIISSALSNGNDIEKNNYLSIKYASLFLPHLDDNLFGKKSTRKELYEEEEEEIKDEVPTDFIFAFKAAQILKNDDKVQLEKNKPNKLFLVYSQDRALGNANEGVVFY
ncbi:hypothetical protein M9Y10_017917 [Tritrichomonas musculus]|uniref:USP domain-containing protein n=1 Tax=Tritrichomonas musculus TaxID=1915356 RepID=A0ABR2HVR7_9EUKA